MLSVKEEMQRLNAEYANDAMSVDAFQKRRDQIFDAIPEVQDAARPARSTGTVILSWVLAMLGVLAATVVVAALIGDLTIAATLCVTSIAAVAVHAYTRLDG